MNYKSDKQQQDKRVYKIPTECAGQRIDQALSALLPEHSRSRLQTWISSGNLLINGETRKPHSKAIGGEIITILDPTYNVEENFTPEDIPLNVIFEDKHIIVLNKPTNVVVHPASGNWSGTILNGILHHYPGNISVPRAGIVHRLDKDTTGLMVVARNLEAQTNLVRQLQCKRVSRIYKAIVYGKTPNKGTIERPIGRHPRNRKKMGIVNTGKSATTHFNRDYGGAEWSSVTCVLETGRTHQIRVHLTSIGHPLIGDQTYSGRTKNFKKIRDITWLNRQALHAKELSFDHPISGSRLKFEALVPEDLEQLEMELRETDNG